MPDSNQMFGKSSGDTPDFYFKMFSITSIVKRDNFNIKEREIFTRQPQDLKINPR